MLQLEKYDENSIMVRLIKTVETVYKDVQTNVNALKVLSKNVNIYTKILITY